ncbi:MAG: hypothetical protein ACREYE_21720 [Gammaproteobacteria bacterium]
MWEKAKGLGLRDSEAASLLLVRLCKSINPHIVSQGIKRFASLSPANDPAFLVRIFSEHPEEPGSPYAFVDLCQFIVGRHEAIRRKLLPAAQRWLQGREDRPEWAFVWQGLLKILLNDVDLRELLELGAKWCRNREECVEYPYVEGELKTRAARYWRELPQTERGAFLQELIIQWTHDSTAIEGNTLSLGACRT